MIKPLLHQAIIKMLNKLKVANGDFVTYGDQKQWQDAGFNILANHYYTPIPEVKSLRKNIFTSPSTLWGIDFHEKGQVRLLSSFKKFSKELGKYKYVSAEIDNQVDPMFYFGNLAFDEVDACIYYSIIRTIKPKLILEVGSGWSTKIAAAASMINKTTKLVSIEPYPQPILKKGFLGLNKLITKKVQDVPLGEFNKLRKNDILFIDSSHTLKTGGDVNYLLFQILPRLRAGVWVHIHDIFLPWEYPEEWIINQNRYWNEQYGVQAFLTHNDHFEVKIGNYFLTQKHAKLVRQIFPFLKSLSSGSLWIRKIK